MHSHAHTHTHTHMTYTHKEVDITITVIVSYSWERLDVWMSNVHDNMETNFNACWLSYSIARTEKIHIFLSNISFSGPWKVAMSRSGFSWFNNHFCGFIKQLFKSIRTVLMPNMHICWAQLTMISNEWPLLRVA